MSDLRVAEGAKKSAEVPLLSDLRRKAGGRYLQLSEGLTYLVDEGHEENPTILLLHGATDRKSVV